MDSAEQQYDKGESRAQKVSVSMPADRIAAVKARVGARGFSAYVSAAVERQIQRDLIEEALVATEAEIGPPTPEVQAWADEIFREAEALAENTEPHDQGEQEWHASMAS
ncbi:hypothetical protein [Streptomyces sp. KLOTTS4A1]|uniref:hypothetical protein n=1 Tax=Streptomyces sp. KLOTTS4A1 TaxID=3390996 RepID=UPI0039F6092B